MSKYWLVYTGQYKTCKGCCFQGKGITCNAPQGLNCSEHVNFRRKKPKNFINEITVVKQKKLYITGVAIIHKNGEVISLPKPNRHNHVISFMVTYLNHPKPVSGEQGFVLSDGSFVDRKKAKIIARKARQIIKARDGGTDELYSEEVW